MTRFSRHTSETSTLCVCVCVLTSKNGLQAERGKLVHNATSLQVPTAIETCRWSPTSVKKLPVVARRRVARLDAAAAIASDASRRGILRSWSRHPPGSLSSWLLERSCCATFLSPRIASCLSAQHTIWFFGRVPVILMTLSGYSDMHVRSSEALTSKVSRV